MMDLGPSLSTSVSPVEDSELQVIFDAGGHRFSVPYGVVEQMVTPPTVVQVPNVHPAVRGVVNLRGVVLGMIDLRTLIGAPSAADEADALAFELDRYRDEHRGWLDGLEAAIRDGRPTGHPRGASECEFGRWYASFRPQQLQLRMLLPRMEEPHERIHEVVERCQAHARRGQTEQALGLIKQTRDTDLSRLERLFDEARESVTGVRREIALVLSVHERTPLALLVDSVDSVGVLTDASVAEHCGDTLGGLIKELATDRDGNLVAALDVEALYLLLT